MISLISNPLEATSVATSTGAKPIYETQTLYEHELHDSSSPVTPQEVIFSNTGSNSTFAKSYDTRYP